jgi:hypothetical protein
VHRATFGVEGQTITRHVVNREGIDPGPRGFDVFLDEQAKEEAVIAYEAYKRAGGTLETEFITDPNEAEQVRPMAVANLTIRSNLLGSVRVYQVPWEGRSTTRGRSIHIASFPTSSVSF